MPKNPFKAPEGSFNIPRNAVDLSENRLFTSDFGKIYPFFSKEVIPGDSFQIDAQVGLRGMPTLFPIQTKMRMSMEFYYCRNRCVYDEFEDFIFKTKDGLVAPWLKLNNSRAKKMISTGSLGDAFRVPTTIGSNSQVEKSWLSMQRLTTINYNITGADQSSYFSNAKNFLSNTVRLLNNPIYLIDFPTNLEDYHSVSNLSGQIFISNPIDSVPVDDSVISFSVNLNLPSVSYSGHTTISVIVDGSFQRFFDTSLSFSAYKISFVPQNSLYTFLRSFDFSQHTIQLAICLFDKGDEGDTSNLVFFYNPDDFAFKYLGASRLIISSPSLPQLFPDSQVHDSTEDDFISSNPFVGNSPTISLNALPFRHYEMIMNYYYRNDKNNPYVLNGQIEYNKFCPSVAGGPDENEYDFHYRNFELDAYTSATQSPQFGEAPLVGLTYMGSGDAAELEFVDSDGVSHSVTVGLDDSGKIENIANFSKDIPSANLRRLQEMINYGISINDLRTSNSFQRFLENTLRRGLRYRNQLKSHFGVSVDYPDIDVPQYIGGASGIITPGQVTNTAQSVNAGLGDYVGTLEGRFSTSHTIHCYCPEHGFIIGVVSFYPIPMYAQNIEKSMIKSDAFDYYQAEFGKIGFVPIHYSEVFPLQTPVDGNVEDVFGYQKAWYDYMRSYDSVHGDFRTTLRNFTLMRTFASRPLLGRDFTEVHPEQFNDIFVANNIVDEYGSSAKFMLSSHVNCIAKRPIPVFGTPSLE